MQTIKLNIMIEFMLWVRNSTEYESFLGTNYYNGKRYCLNSSKDIKKLYNLFKKTDYYKGIS